MNMNTTMLITDIVLLLVLAILVGVLLYFLLRDRKKPGKKPDSPGTIPAPPPDSPPNTPPLKGGGVGETVVLDDGYTLYVSGSNEFPRLVTLRPSERVLVGREKDLGCQIVLTDTGVSRTHCYLEARPDGVYIWDRPGVKNPTRVDRIPISGEKKLFPGQQLRIGRETLRIDNIQKNGDEYSRYVYNEVEKPVFNDDNIPADEIEEPVKYDGPMPGEEEGHDVNQSGQIPGGGADDPFNYGTPFPDESGPAWEPPSESSSKDMNLLMSLIMQGDSESGDKLF